MFKRFTLLCSSLLLLTFGNALSVSAQQTGTECNKQGACATAAECSDTAKFENLTALDCPAGYVCCRVKTSSQGPTTAPAPASTGPTKSTQLGNPLCGRNPDGSFKSCDFADVDIISILNRVIKTFLGLAGSFGLLAFVWGGIMWMTAGGEKGRLEKAQKIIKNAVIGIVIIVFAYLITSVFLDLIVPAKSA